MASFEWPQQSGGGGGSVEGFVGSVTATAASPVISVVFSTAFSSAAYRVSISLVNTVDAADDLLFLSHVVTAKSAAGFTVRFNAPLTTNYSMDYIAIGDT